MESRYKTKRVVWSQDHDGKWNGLIIKGRANEVRKAVETEIARCKAHGFDGHVTNGFNKIFDWTCQPSTCEIVTGLPCQIELMEFKKLRQK